MGVGGGEGGVGWGDQTVKRRRARELEKKRKKKDQTITNDLCPLNFGSRRYRGGMG